MSSNKNNQTLQLNFSKDIRTIKLPEILDNLPNKDDILTK